jgi:hypothetical protein
MVMARRPARLSEGDVAGRRNGLLDMVLSVFRTRTREVGEMWCGLISSSNGDRVEIAIAI